MQHGPTSGGQLQVVGDRGGLKPIPVASQLRSIRPVPIQRLVVARQRGRIGSRKIVDGSEKRGSVVERADFTGHARGIGVDPKADRPRIPFPHRSTREGNSSSSQGGCSNGRSSHLPRVSCSDPNRPSFDRPPPNRHRCPTLLRSSSTIPFGLNAFLLEAERVEVREISCEIAR